MRFGFTTGSCAAAAAKAAAYMMLSGSEKKNIEIQTPKGATFNAEIVDIRRGGNCVKCGVVKDGGDDPDITTGAVVYAEVTIEDGEGKKVIVDGGEGVGRVTKPGLDQMVGNAAINSVPRQMIEKEVREVMDLFDVQGTVKVIISVPAGVEIAKNTFNPRLGIEGGISILGTSGVVEPMSTQAILDTIFVELRQRKELGFDTVVIAPGNYGLDFIKSEYGYNLDYAVKCSNYIGNALDMAAELGFKRALLCGHIGKMIKVSGGIMNTHSKEADCRIELMISAAFKAGADRELLERISECVTTDAAYTHIKQYGIEKEFMEIVMDRIVFYLRKRAAGRFEIESIVFSNEFGLMGESSGARAFMEEMKNE